MARKNIPPPPPPRGGSSSGGGTATTAPSTSATPYYSLSEIDDDDSAAAAGGGGVGAPLLEDDATEISDVDSILEMAKRLDAASVISDPSFIEGPAHHHHQHPSRGAYRMDEIASESDEEESSNSSSEDDSSSDDSDSSSSSSGEEDGRENHHRRHHRGRYDYKHGGSKGSRSTHSDRRRYNQRKHISSDNEGMMRSHRGSGSGGGRSDRRRRNHRQQQQQQQQHSSSMPSQPYYDNSYDSRGQQQQQQHNMMSYQGGGERKYSPPRGVGTTAIDPMMMYTTTINNNNNSNNIPKKQSRGPREDPNQRFSSTTTTKNSAAASSSYENQAAYEKRQKQERYYDREEATESVKRRRTKMIVIPLVVIVIIGVVIAVAVAVGGKGGGGGESGNTKDLQENNDNINAFQPIPVPTTSPTYFGLYQCPYGKSGLTATKGCLGFIECSDIGTAVGEIQYCSSGTLYDVKSGVCDFAENVSCSTNLPTQEEIAASQQGTSPMTTPVNTPPTTDVVGVVPPPQNSPSITVGPMITSDHKLLFEGVTNPGQMNNNAMNTIAKNLEAYLNIFYSARVIDAYNDDDYILESISNVTIGVVAKNFVFVQSNRRNLRRLQTVAIKANGLTMTYQQTTKYDTIDSSITVGAIVRHPYQERYQERIVSYLKAVDPDTFSTLTRALFVEGDVGGQPAPQPQPSTNPPQPTRKPTSAPTKQSNNPPPAVLQTNPPSKAPITPPPVAATVPGTSESYTIQGFIFFDENMDGKFDYDNEKPFQGVWANLRLCTPKENGNDWVNTGASQPQGMYKFENVEEGEYFIEFFKPSPGGDNYNFTLPQVAGTDGSVLDSDVIGMTPHGGKTACFTVGPGFDSNKYINAGYKLKPTSAPTTAPSNSPTQSPIDISYYCADVTTTSAGNQNFNFLGCQIRCGNGFSECPGNTRCVFADMCIEPV